MRACGIHESDKFEGVIDPPLQKRPAGGSAIIVYILYDQAGVASGSMGDGISHS